MYIWSVLRSVLVASVFTCACLMTAVSTSSAASAASLVPQTESAQWFELNTDPDESAFEVDLTSLRWRGERREFRVRITQTEGSLLGPDARYRSVLATLQVDCGSGQAYWRSTSFHVNAKAEGSTLAGDIYLNGPPGTPVQDLISEKTWATLRRSACVQPRPSGR